MGVGGEGDYLCACPFRDSENCMTGPGHQHGGVDMMWSWPNWGRL